MLGHAHPGADYRLRPKTLYTGDGLQRREQCPAEFELIRAYGNHGLFEFHAATLVTCLHQTFELLAPIFLADPFKIFNGSKHTGNTFVILCACFKFARQKIRGWTHLVGKQLSPDSSRLPYKDAGMCAKEFIG